MIDVLCHIKTDDRRISRLKNGEMFGQVPDLARLKFFSCLSLSDIMSSEESDSSNHYFFCVFTVYTRKMCKLPGTNLFEDKSDLISICVLASGAVSGSRHVACNCRRKFIEKNEYLAYVRMVHTTCSKGKKILIRRSQQKKKIVIILAKNPKGRESIPK